MTDTCPLCNSKGEVFYNKKNRLYHQCTNCLGIFVDQEILPTRVDEELRYKEHNNDVDNKGYQKFVSPITNAIMNNFAQNHLGLDFGAGTGPVISKILEDNNFNIVKYDPIFCNYSELLKKKYNYIACCEVMEHFHNPKKEFALLKNLLLPDGKLYCLTHLYSADIKFANWYYKNDFTHVFIYQFKTLSYIKETFGFKDLSLDKKLITFTV